MLERATYNHYLSVSIGQHQSQVWPLCGKWTEAWRAESQQTGGGGGAARQSCVLTLVLATGHLCPLSVAHVPILIPVSPALSNQVKASSRLSQPSLCS